MPGSSGTARRACPCATASHAADDPAVLVPRDFAAVTGACVIIRRATFFELGAFDDGYHMYVEDVDLCLRAWEAGLRVTYCPDERARAPRERLGHRSRLARRERQRRLAAARAALVGPLAGRGAPRSPGRTSSPGSPRTPPRSASPTTSWRIPSSWRSGPACSGPTTRSSSSTAAARRRSSRERSRTSSWRPGSTPRRWTCSSPRRSPDGRPHPGSRRGARQRAGRRRPGVPPWADEHGIEALRGTAAGVTLAA